MKLQIKTLSPIHIGNGEKYNGLSYVEDISSNPKRVFFVDLDRIKSVLNQEELQTFMNWVTSEKYPLKKPHLQRDPRARRSSLDIFCEFELKKPHLQREFQKNATYILPNYSTERTLRDIECFIKQNNKPYIPGTEIKGVIRTAVAYHLLQKDAHWTWLKKELESFGNKNKQKLQQIPGKKGRWVNDIKKGLVKEMGKLLEERLQTRLLRADNYNDAKYDLLKLLYIGDTESKDPEDCLFVSNLEVKGINGRFLLFQELCKKDTIFTCQGFKLENNKLIFDKLGFSPEQKLVVEDVLNLFKCCYEFTNRILQEEIGYFNRHNIGIVARLKDIQQQNAPHSPVIRIGKNEGYLSLTLGLLVKDKDKNLYDNVLCHATKNTSYTGNFPKTRRVVDLSNNEQDTFGWVKLSI